MPENEQHFYTARDLIKTFTSKYKSILLVTREDMEILAEHKGKVYHYSDVDRNRMIIREKDLNAMPSKTDIAIDLNLKPTLLSAYITGTRGRKMTVGMRSGEFDRFYTVLMRSGKSYQDTIRTIFSFLGFMKS